MTKRGKEIKMDLSDNYNIVSGTIDNKNTRAIYINLSAWGEPTIDEELDYARVISRLSKCVKQSTYDNIKSNYEDRIYPDRTIVDLDMRESGVKFGKRSFMNCELTIFKKLDGGPINDDNTIDMLENIIMESISCLDSFEYFDFNKKKI